MSKCGRLRGVADLIDVRADLVEIADYKTGIANDADTPSMVESRQLQLYGYLLHAETGRWATSLWVDRPGGARCEVVASPAEMVALAEEVLAAFEHLKGADATILASTARPSTSACSTCPCKAWCSTYWERQPPDVPQELNLEGETIEVDGWEAVVAQRSGAASVRVNFKLMGALPWPGQHVRICRLVAGQGGRPARIGRHSSAWSLGEA